MEHKLILHYEIKWTILFCALIDHVIIVESYRETIFILITGGKMDRSVRSVRLTHYFWG
jgi:hypothetical protein